jgi:hypothetical protein
MPSPAPCPTPQGCPNPEPCSEVVDSQCVIYTGPNIMCGETILIATNTNLADALQAIADTLCAQP